MISKSFIIQAFIALIILASSLTFSVNAAAIAIAPARISRQDYEQPAALSAVSTADNEKRFWFARKAYESTVGLPRLLPISERALRRSPTRISESQRTLSR